MTSPLAGRRVLVVEDEMMVAWLLEDMLADLGCTPVGPAVRIDEALAMIGAEAFDAAVLDINLDGEMSYPVADALIARGLPFVFSTGYHKDRLPLRYRDVEVMQKPFHGSELGDTLTNLFRSRPRPSPTADSASEDGARPSEG